MVAETSRNPKSLDARSNILMRCLGKYIPVIIEGSFVNANISWLNKLIFFCNWVTLPFPSACPLLLRPHRTVSFVSRAELGCLEVHLCPITSPVFILLTLHSGGLLLLCPGVCSALVQYILPQGSHCRLASFPLPQLRLTFHQTLLHLEFALSPPAPVVSV